jgi:hypothetical protein
MGTPMAAPHLSPFIAEFPSCQEGCRNRKKAMAALGIPRIRAASGDETATIVKLMLRLTIGAVLSCGVNAI